MKLNQALTRLRNLRSKVSRVETCIEECAVHYEDEVPPYVYSEELVKRNNLLSDIRDLKSRIQVTNATTTVNFGGAEKTLAELILINADIRSEMAFLSKQLQHSTEASDIWSRRSGGRSKESVKKVYAEGFDKVKFQKMLNDLESKKENLEEVLGQANASTDLV